METTIGDYIGTTKGFHSPIPYEALDSKSSNPGLEDPSFEPFACTQQSG